MSDRSARMLRIVVLAVALAAVAACNSEILERQAEQIRQQELEINRQRKELEALAAGQKVQDAKQKDCVRAFRDYFDKAQSSANAEQAIALYREGLKLCPEDDVAYYELGRLLAKAGRRGEAAAAFEAALKINPAFTDAKRQLDAIQNR